MALPTVRRIRKVGIKLSLALCIPYLIFAVFGYLSLGSSMRDKDFALFPSKPPLSYDPEDILMKIFKCALILSLCSTIIVNSIPLKTILIDHFKLRDTNCNHVLLAALICVVTATLSYGYPEITNWMTLLGALGANSLTVLLPSLCFYKAVKGKPEYKTILGLVIVWATVTTLASFACIGAIMCDLYGYHPDW